MIDLGFTDLAGELLEPVALPQPICDAAATALLPDARADEPPAVRQPFVNSRRNGRLGVSLGGAAAFALARRVELPHQVRARWLLHASGRIAVVGENDWRLFDGSGAFVAQGVSGEGSLTLHPERSVFYEPSRPGSIATRDLATGAHLSYIEIFGSGDEFDRTLIAVNGRRLICASTELPVDMGQPEPENSTVEMVELPASPAEEVPHVTAALARATRTLLAALGGDTLVLASDDRLWFATTDLRIRTSLGDSFAPQAMSVDEAGRVYLVNAVRGRHELWVLAETGERHFSFTIPGAVVIAPPIVGYDHVTYLLGAAYIFAVGTDGKLEWSRAAEGRIVGGVVTTDGQLLVTEGTEVAAYDGRGDRRVLFTSPGEPFTTPPILTDTGDLLVASHAALYRLVPGTCE